MSIEIIETSAEATYELRHGILRPNQPLEMVIYPGDLLETSKHFIATEDNTTLGIVSIYLEQQPGLDHTCQYRLRGMAVVPELRGKNIGRRLVESGLQSLPRHSLLWCNARVSALDFYRKTGFEIFGDEFEIEDIGPHFVMTLLRV